MLVAVVLLLLSLSAPAHAYIDPSAGSVLLQLLGLAGVLVALRLYWNRLTGLFRRRQGSTTDEGDRIQ